MKQTNAKSKLLNAALKLIRTSGYEATAVDELCTEAGVTKGAFFHHFKSKQDLALEAAAHWSTMTGALFASAPYHDYEDPLDQLIAYIDFRAHFSTAAAFRKSPACSAPWCRKPSTPIRSCAMRASPALQAMPQPLRDHHWLPKHGTRRVQAGRAESAGAAHASRHAGCLHCGQSAE